MTVNENVVSAMGLILIDSNFCKRADCIQFRLANFVFTY